MAPSTLGFVGLGVMGEPMCRNLAAKSGARVVAFDLRPEPLARLAEVGVASLPRVADIVEAAEVIFLSLPGGAEVEKVCLGDGGIVDLARPGQTVVDLSTAPVALARRLAAALAEKGAGFADAPVARTREAAIAGTLSIMVGADAATFDKIRPLLACMGSDVTLCGGVGCGQVVKILNNMVLFETVVALAEALTIGERAGVDGALLFETLGKGSADSFALRNHGMKSLLPRNFPANAFSTLYAMKDLGYALDLATEAGVDAAGARNVARLLEESRRRGNGDVYFPAVIEAIAG